jgi:hypothetical protein
MTTDTVQHQLPYKFFKLIKDRVMIVHPEGAKIILEKWQIINRLEMGKSGEFRELSSHEVLMLETALKTINE